MPNLLRKKENKISHKLRRKRARNGFDRRENDQSNNPGCIRTCDLPFRPVLAPKTNTVRARTVTAVFIVQLCQTSAKCGPALLNGLVVEPLIVPKLPSDGVVGAPPKTVGLWLTIRSRFEHVMSCGDLRRHNILVSVLTCAYLRRRKLATYLRIQGLQQGILRVPSTVDLTPARLFGARHSNGIGSPLGGFFSQLCRTSSMEGLRREHDGMAVSAIPVIEESGIFSTEVGGKDEVYLPKGMGIISKGEPICTKLTFMVCTKGKQHPKHHCERYGKYKGGDQ